MVLLLLVLEEAAVPCINDIDTRVCLLGPATAISSIFELSERILRYVLVTEVVTEDEFLSQSK